MYMHVGSVHKPVGYLKQEKKPMMNKTSDRLLFA